MSSEQDERLRTELSLLEAMYPGQILYQQKRREMKYTSDVGCFELRLPDSYLSNDLPEVLSASAGRADLREQLRQYVQECDSGEEILDSIVANFDTLAASSAYSLEQDNHDDKRKASIHNDASRATIVVWLHHLLNTNKRKQALSPPSPGVSGITKPGYPGVLVYSGPAEAVHEHVSELRQLNWQAFQVRLESEEEWRFDHEGVREVESMKEVVAGIGDEKRELFLEVMRMK